MTKVYFSVQLNNRERVDPSALTYKRFYPPPPPPPTHTHFLSPHVIVTYRTWWCVEWLQWHNESIASVYQVRVRRSHARSCLIKDCAAGRGGFLSKCLQRRTLSAIPRLVSAACLTDASSAWLVESEEGTFWGNGITSPEHLRDGLFLSSPRRPPHLS